MGFTPLSQLLNKSLKRSGIDKQVHGALILNSFIEKIKEIFGERNMKKIKPLFVKNNALTISCENSIIAQEIKLRESEIIEYINIKIPQEKIEKIRITYE